MKIIFERLRRFGQIYLHAANPAAVIATQLARRKCFKEKDVILLEQLGHEVEIVPYVFEEGEYKKGASAV
jgi:hypothetical protein